MWSDELMAAIACAATGVAATQMTPAAPSRPMLFLGDLDGTLHGTSEHAQASLSNWTKFWKQTEAPLESVLCYNTGRCITDYQNELESSLPMPDVLITGDGTEIRWVRRRLGWLELDETWSRQVGACWHAVSARLIERMDRDDEGHIAALNIASNSPPAGEARYAITVLSKARACALRDAYAADFADDGIRFYVMGGWDAQKSHLIVALPASCGKANAAKHVQRQLGFDDAQCIAAGDSENDTTMLDVEFAFILVANAADALVREVDARRAPDLHFRARGTHASGVVEGLQHFRRAMDSRDRAQAGAARVPLARPSKGG